VGKEIGCGVNIDISQQRENFNFGRRDYNF
jgi:hypothetical protein